MLADDGNGGTTTYEYDSIGRKTRTIDALGQTTRYILDNRGNLLTEIAGEGLPEQVTTTSTYDIYNRRLSTTDGVGNTTQFAYDTQSRLVGMRGPTGVETRRTYAGRFLQEDPIWFSLSSAPPARCRRPQRLALRRQPAHAVDRPEWDECCPGDGN